MRTLWVASLCYVIIFSISTARAQQLPSASEFQSLLTTCAQGSNWDLKADIIGSATTVYEGERTKGVASLSSQTKFLELFPLEDRLEALRLYNDCIVKFLDREQPQSQGSAAYGTSEPIASAPIDRSLSYQAPIRAGFDCFKASTPTELLICSNASLASADLYLNLEYRALLDIARRSGFDHELRSAQKDWLAYRDSVCPVSAQTLRSTYEAQRAIACLMQESDERATLLASGQY